MLESQAIPGTQEKTYVSAYGVQPWGTAAAKATLAMPKNAATGRAYSGVNVLILWGAVIEHGFPSQSWLTFRQALSLGGNVCKGEHGTTVVYADRFVPDDEKRRARETGEEAQAIPFLKRFTVLVCVPRCCDFIRQGSRFRGDSGIEAAFVTARSDYGVLSWRAIWNARHVFDQDGILHAITGALIVGVYMACNTNRPVDGSAARLAADIP